MPRQTTATANAFNKLKNIYMTDFLTGMHNNGFYWSTFYHGTKRYSLPEGATAYTMDKDYYLYRLGDDGRTIPEDKAVVIVADKQGIILTPDDSTSTITDHAPDGNILLGSDSPVTPTSAFVVLGIVDNDPATLGFHYCKFSIDYIPAHKAYYIKTQ